MRQSIGVGYHLMVGPHVITSWQFHSQYRVITKSWHWTFGLIHTIMPGSCIVAYIYIHTHTYMYTYIHRCLLALILMHWQQGSDIESKGDQLSSFAEYRIRTQGLWNRISIRLNARWQTDWSIEDQANKLEIYSPSLYDQQASSPLDPTADMVSHLALAICFVGVNLMHRQPSLVPIMACRLIDTKPLSEATCMRIYC